MREAVEGQLYAGVPGEVLNVLRVGATSEQDREAGVPQIVPTDRGETSVLEERLEVPVNYVLGVEGSTFPGGEHEP
jgi:hypothetical protein